MVVTLMKNDWKKMMYTGISTIVVSAGLTFFPLNDREVKAQQNNNQIIQIFFNEEPLILAQQPTHQQGHLFVPIREFMESIGATVNWYDTKKMAEVKTAEVTVYFYPNEQMAKVQSNQGEIIHDKIQIENQKGRLFVPVQNLAECIGAQIQWDGHSLKIVTDGEEKISEEEMVKKFVVDFGKQLQKVSLLAPREQLEKDLMEHYGPFVADSLLEKWLKDPSTALGRLTSSPWPDRIDVDSISKVDEKIYVVSGEIVEITALGEEVGREKVEFTVEKQGDTWKITNALKK